MFTPKLGEDEPILTSICFSNGLVQPPTSEALRLGGSPKRLMFKLMLQAFRGEPPVMKSAATRKWWSAP